LKISIRNKLNNDQSFQNAISHKQLSDYLIKAKKEKSSIITSENKQIKENHEFNDLIQDWTKTSQQILLILNKNESDIAKNKNSKSLLAFGAMGAHINMALQALKATESD
tara:strand:- start:302 stop:631 length:330 start_codon:yes stop_codon:yes gene_type:complete